MLERSSRASSKRVPFVFISASEAGWSTSLPFAPTVERALPDFLQRYLKSKRAVEHKMLEPASFKIRPIILRPVFFPFFFFTRCSNPPRSRYGRLSSGPPISPMCRTPLFPISQNLIPFLESFISPPRHPFLPYVAPPFSPYLRIQFFFLPTAGRPYGEFGAPHGVNVAPHTRTRAISTWLRRVETRAHLHRRSTQGLGGGGQTVGG